MKYLVKGVTVTADKADLSDGVLKKLDWIAKLSKETFPGGLVFNTVR